MAEYGRGDEYQGVLGDLGGVVMVVYLMPTIFIAEHKDGIGEPEDEASGMQ